MTDGQASAREQLQEISEASDGSVELISESTSEDGSILKFEISIRFDGLERAPEGLPVRAREHFHLAISPQFPFVYPRVAVAHDRFAGFPHVQWRRHPCLYQSTLEWDPDGGMYGFVARLDQWVRDAAVCNLDPDDAPLHPPVAYESTARLVVPRADTPDVGEGGWVGYAELQEFPNRTEIAAWVRASEGAPAVFAPAILLPRPLPFEYPGTVNELLKELDDQGIETATFLWLLAALAARTDRGLPLLVVLGTPMRRVEASGPLLQHLAVWEVSGEDADQLREMQKSSGEPSEEGRDAAIAQVAKWSLEAKVGWCPVREMRPEVTRRRDSDSPMSWFRGKRVEIWGCGAIGSRVAESIARAGASTLRLIDNGTVVPGILVRQCFDESDIGRPKAEALGDRLRRVDSQLEAEALASNLLYLLDDPSPFSDVDIIIDCTASQPVRTKAERVLRSEGVRPPIASLGIGFDASSAIATLSMPGHSGGTLDLLRRLKIAACRDPSVLGALRDTFWPSEGDPARFQPEPGCSEPTFVGSDADLASLSARAMNAIANALRSHDQPSAAAGWMFSGGGELHEFGWSSELVLDDPSHEFSIRISPEALREMRGWARRSERTAGRDCETGGLIFGELSEAAGVLWVTEVAGPPPDSDASALHFTCGVEGMEEAAAEKEGRFRKSVRCVGSWHTHPRSRAEPSEVDIGAVYQLLATPGSNRRTCLLLILSGSPDDPTMGAHLFRTERRLQNSVVVSMDASSTSGISNDVTSPRDVGLALSGGGSRAIAFHLGCLRALADLDLLDRLQVISSVSGGSVIAAMYAYSSEDFADFDARVTSLLREGLVGEIAKAWLTPGSMARTAAAMLRNVPSSMLRGLGAMLPSGLQRGLLDPRSVPPARAHSRAEAFRTALARTLFGEVKTSEVVRDSLDVVINATELRTGSAFRFGSRESGCWRFGTIAPASSSVADAVAASAAYPVFLPALDREYRFSKRGKDVGVDRVLLTDGGVFENLGVGPMEPGRSPDVSTNVFDPKYIISCDAGGGLFDADSFPMWWPTRMHRSFLTTFRKVQDATRNRLHRHAATGAISGFAFAYLGQIDESLPWLPPDLPRRHEVYTYPTNFSPMAEADIERLARRGEVLMRELLAYYLPEL